MPAFVYKGVTTSGKNAKGSITAENLRAARARMRADGIFVTDISETAEGVTRSADGPTGWNQISVRLAALSRIPAMERAVATRQLATLVGAGRSNPTPRSSGPRMVECTVITTSSSSRTEIVSIRSSSGRHVFPSWYREGSPG